MGALSDYLAAKSQPKPNLTQANILPSGDGGPLADPKFRSDVGGGIMDALNRGMVGQTLGAPVDIANILSNLGKAAYGTVGHATGLLSADQMPDLTDTPVGGSEWIGKKMQDMGIVSGNRNPTAEMLAGGLSALVGGAAGARLNPGRVAADPAGIMPRSTVYDGYPGRVTASATAETAPGIAGVHRTDVTTAHPAIRRAYHYQIPDSDMGVDPIYRAAGYDQEPQSNAFGNYKNSQGQVENQPLTISKPVLPIGADGRVPQHVMDEVQTLEQYRGLRDAQEASALNVPLQGSGYPNRSVLLKNNNTASGDHLAHIDKLLSDPSFNGGYGVSATDKGALVFPFDNSTTAGGPITAANRFAPAMERAYPGSVASMGDAQTAYTPAFGKFDAKYNIIPTGPGEATQSLLENLRDKVRPSVVQGLSRDPVEQSSWLRKAARDDGFPSTQQSIQNTRAFMGSGDFHKVVDLMTRKNMAPAAAMAALGYSLNSMAAEHDR